MRSSLANLSIRIALIAALILLLSGWTCSALFVSCQGVVAQPQITSLSPDTIPSDAQSVLLTVEEVVLLPNHRSFGTEAHCRRSLWTQTTFRQRLLRRPSTPLAVQQGAVYRFQ